LFPSCRPRPGPVGVRFIRMHRYPFAAKNLSTFFLKVPLHSESIPTAYKSQKYNQEIAMEIRLVKSVHELHQVYLLRYKVYVEEMGLNPPEVDHSRRMITDPLDATGTIPAAFSGGKVVGTVRINRARDTDMGEWQHLLGMDRLGPFFRDRVSMTTRLLVSQAFRNSTLGVRLSKAVLRLDYDLGTRF